MFKKIFFLLMTAFLLCGYPLHPQDTACDTGILLDSITDRLCIPGSPIDKVYTIDGTRGTGEWEAANYYLFNEYDGSGARVYVARKNREFGKTDLYLFFEVSGLDGVPTFDDEVRVGLNPGISNSENTLIKYRPWGSSGAETDVFIYDGPSDTWGPPTVAWPGGDFAHWEDAGSASWAVEMRIPLEDLPHPITGTDFRLFLELQVDDNVSVITFRWPAHYTTDDHTYICTNPERWRPMSFGGDCFPDLHINNGLYSCDSIYIRRNSAKTSNIYVHEDNKFHADVVNPHGSKNAVNVKVYMTLLKFGTSTEPLAMNYDHTDAAVKNWFEQKWGTWLLAVDHLDHATPNPPTPFDVNASTTNTAERLSWQPADETRFGDPSNMAGSHRCTAAFVDYKNDPNFENNLSYCNTQMVDTLGARRFIHPFWMGPYIPYVPEPGCPIMLLKLRALNEPYRGWFDRSQFNIRGKDAEVRKIAENLYEAPLPPKGNHEMLFTFTMPRDPGDDGKGIFKKPLAGPAAYNAGEEMERRLRKIYGNRPIVLIEGLVPAGYKWVKARGKKEKVDLYRIASYAAFAVKLPPGAKAFELTLPYAGWTFFDNASGLKDGPVFGARLGYWLTGRLTLELEAGFGLTEDIFMDKGNWIQLLGNLRFHLSKPRVGRWSPFVTAGAGLVMFKGMTLDDETFVFHGGVGVTYKFASSFGLRLESRAFRFGKVMTAPATTNVQATAGLIFWL